MRFVLDHDVSVKVRKVVCDAGHECWTAAQAGLGSASDSALTVYALDKKAVLVSDDRGLAQRRKENTIGQHVWLRCREIDATAVMSKYLQELVAQLQRMPDVVVTLTVERMEYAPARWR